MKTNKVKTLILGGYGYVGSQIDGDLRIGRNEVDLCKKNETYRFIKNTPRTGDSLCSTRSIYKLKRYK